MNVAILFALILLNGAFAMSEIALVMSRKARLQPLADEGDVGASAALRLHAEPTRLLSTVQIGITSISILNGIVGEAAIAPTLAEWLRARGFEGMAAGHVGTGPGVLLMPRFPILGGGAGAQRRVARCESAVGGERQAHRGLRAHALPRGARWPARYSRRTKRPHAAHEGAAQPGARLEGRPAAAGVRAREPHRHGAPAELSFFQCAARFRGR